VSDESLVRRYLRDAWGDGDATALDDLLAPDFCDHDAPPGYGSGLAEHLRLVADMAAGAEGRRLRILAVVAGEASVAVRLETTWTQRGDLFGIPADGRQVVLGSMDLYRLRDGRIAECWHVEDLAGLARRLGG
jgi:ketosteroid isomerase-like protein